MPISTETTTLLFNKLRFIFCFILVCMFCNGFSAGVVGLAYAKNIKPPLTQTLSALESDLWIATYKQLSIEELAQKADAGDAKAQCELGILYDDGEGGLEQDYAKAKHYYELAVSQNHAKAQFRLARMYDFPRGIEQDYAKAKHYYELSAEQGNASAQYNLALMYDLGEGIEQNYERAIHYYTLAAEQGDAEAQHNLALMYDFGEGVEQNYEKARFYYILAAKQGIPDAQHNLAIKYYRGEGGPKNYQKAVYYYELAMKQGMHSSQFNLALMYFLGEHVPKNYEKALSLIKEVRDEVGIKAWFMYYVVLIYVIIF